MTLKDLECEVLRTSRQYFNSNTSKNHDRWADAVKAWMRQDNKQKQVKKK